jgi:CfrBI restriction endonuclease
MTRPNLTDLFPEAAAGLLEVRGIDLVEKLGLGAIREVVSDVLCGVNLRNATETLTRRRIALLNAALVVAYARARANSADFPSGLADHSRSALQAGRPSAANRRILLWSLGLTQKQVQNVLRSDDAAWDHYVNQLADDLVDLAEDSEESYGNLSASIRIGTEDEVDVDWLWLTYLAMAVGSQTLATRGSEKSMYGKFFEKLILGGVLHLMGLSLVDTDDISSEDVFWLSSRGHKRESDATALFGRGRGIRFDIGFIGTGNTEVSLDKVSRFEREVEIGGESHFMHTFIIVDRIGAGSRIVELAEEIDGTILQMSANYWPKTLGERLEDVVPGFSSPLAGLQGHELRAAIAQGVADAPFERILRLESGEASDELVEQDT